MKRLMDIAIAATVLAVALPVLLPVALIVVLDSPGPIFYRRHVVGRRGKPFYAYKLRTMVEESDPSIITDGSLVKELENRCKLKEDPRVTRVGKYLRKASIDELPQLLNVLKGEMSLVGPRMISFPELEKFGPWQDKILEVKPGITGLWQVSGRSNLEYDDRVRLNVYYVDNRSITLDVTILAKTIPAVISARGAY
jgi:lipopolysaccharide/colanic/teichoic acid biosynthesis glycosyltransferase